jgi:pimeloyl-ACP methyl ester carboxylesterase
MRRLSSRLVLPAAGCVAAAAAQRRGVREMPQAYRDQIDKMKRQHAEKHDTTEVRAPSEKVAAKMRAEAAAANGGRAPRVIGEDDHLRFHEIEADEFEKLDAAAAAEAAREAGGPSAETAVTADDPDAVKKSMSKTTEGDDVNVLYGGLATMDAEQAALDAAADARADAVKAGGIRRETVSTINEDEAVAIDFQKFVAQQQQQGPYIGSSQKDAPNGALERRRRREMVRVPPIAEAYEGAETSFRRMSPRLLAKLPDEQHLRAIYPMRTSLPIEWRGADVADGNSLDIDEDPEPIRYGILYPENYNPDKYYPTMVILSDMRGMELDFEDVCSHLLERDAAYERWAKEDGWVVISPVISVKHSQMMPIEGVVARFVDYVTDNYKVEHGKVHLVGKGLGGYLALRTCMEHKQLALSVTAVLGRMAAPFRPLERPQEKVRNMNGTHTLLIVPGGMRKLEWVYKFKSVMDVGAVRPPCRALHYAEVRDHQLYYAINTDEFWNYMAYFRTHNYHSGITTTESGFQYGEVQPTTPQ